MKLAIGTTQLGMKYGAELISNANEISKNIGIQDFFKFSGIACSPIFNCLDNKRNNSLEFRTLFIQEMLKQNILMPWVSISYRHSDQMLNKTSVALEKTLYIYKKALKYGVKKFLKGHVIKPVFRKFN